MLWLPAQPAAAQVANDTLPGQATLTRQLAASLCARIGNESGKQPFEKMSPKQADDLFMRLTMASMGDHAADFSALMSEAQRRKMSSTRLGRNIGSAAVKQLSIDCPGAMPLLLRTSSAQKEMGSRNSKSMNDISAEEKEALQPMADTLCVKLAAEDARRPFKLRPSAERTEAVTGLMQTVVLQNMSSLLTIYSMEQLQSKASMESFGLKLATLMMSQCPSYIVMMGEDMTKGR